MRTPAGGSAREEDERVSVWGGGRAGEEKQGIAGFYMGERDMENSTKEADWIANYCTKQTTCHKRKTLQSMLNIHNALKKQHIINNKGIKIA